MVNQEMLDARQQRVMIVRRDHLHMQRHHGFFSYHPDMDVMHIAYFGNIPAEMATQRRDIQRNRRAFQ